MIHLAGFFLSADNAGVLTQLPAVSDQVLSLSNNNIRTPTGMNFVLGAFTGTTTTSTFTVAQVQAPSLRDMWYPDITAYSDALPNATDLVPVVWYGGNAFELVPNENVGFWLQNDSGAAVSNYGFIWLSDGPVTPVSGDIKSVRCTTSVTAVTGSWVNTALTFTQTLPYGDYQVVGLRAYGAGTVAARLVFPGGTWRPGTIATSAASNVGLPAMQGGAPGDLGVFNTNTPPSVDIMGTTGAITPTVVLDLIKVG